MGRDVKGHRSGHSHVTDAAVPERWVLGALPRHQGLRHLGRGYLRDPALRYLLKPDLR
ncbi:MAG TPA: hypothetical protein VMW47_08245 [Verrucomicrobiae bacterium]|nr:hypothetical protein [Verrucomicrobiae bacterium]